MLAMTDPTTRDVLAFALALADEADAITMRYYRGETATRAKADGTLVTLADTETETALRRRVAERFPSHAVLGEEEGYRPGRPSAGSGQVPGDAPRWVLDPVDGTHNFARSIPIWATLIAFERGGVFEVGVASAPALGVRWWAGRGLGAFRATVPSGGSPPEGERIHVSGRASVGDAQVLYGSYTLTLGAWDGRADHLLREAWRTRGLGDFWGHCLVAEGAAEVMLEGEISPWDIAAIVPIVEEAGGRLTDVDGNATVEAGHSITTNGVLHDEVLRRLRG